MSYCTPNDPTEEPLYSWITCPECDGEGRVMTAKLYPTGHTEVIETCPYCNGDGEVIFEQE